MSMIVTSGVKDRGRKIGTCAKAPPIASSKDEPREEMLRTCDEAMLWSPLLLAASTIIEAESPGVSKPEAVGELKVVKG